MTSLRPLLAGILLALTASGCVQAAAAATARRVVVVVDAAAARDPAVLAEARAAVGNTDGAELRVPRTPTEQLSVTAYFAARGFDVLGVGLTERIAVTPVSAHYDDVRFTTTQPGAVTPALRDDRP